MRDGVRVALREGARTFQGACGSAASDSARLSRSRDARVMPRRSTMSLCDPARRDHAGMMPPDSTARVPAAPAKHTRQEGSDPAGTPPESGLIDERDRQAFLDILSHELRTPVTTIYGGAQLLAKRELKGNRRRALAEDVRSRRIGSIAWSRTSSSSSTRSGTASSRSANRSRSAAWSAPRSNARSAGILESRSPCSVQATRRPTARTRRWSPTSSATCSTTPSAMAGRGDRSRSSSRSPPAR